MREQSLLHLRTNDRKHMKNALPKISATLGCLFILLSCKTATPVTLDVSCQNVLNHEWVSFFVKTSYYENGVLQYDILNSQVMIHNAPDIAQRQLVVVNEDGSCARLTSDNIIYINPNYKTVGQYASNNIFYEELCMDILQEALEYFPMYYISYAGSLITYANKTTEYEVIDNDTLYAIPATKQEKHCHSNGTCELKEIPITLYFSNKSDGFVMAKKVVSKWPVRKEFVSSISDITFDDCASITDSMFCENFTRYVGYDFVSGDDYLPYRYTTDNTEGTDDVVRYPLVNLSTGDTTTLANMTGNTLLCLFNFNLDEDTYKMVEHAAKRLNNIIWLMPASNNVDKLKEMSDTNHFTANIYYTKGFNRVLSILNRYYLFDSNHRVVSFNNGSKVEQWLETEIRNL